MKKNIAQEMQSFRTQYPIQSKQVDTLTWHYYDVGKGKDTIVIFPDIMGTYESWFPYIPLLSKTHRVIIPFYPPIADLEKMVESLHALLKSQHVTSYSLIGASLGGLFAQVYIRRYPKEITKLLLIGTGTADRVFGTIAAGLFLAGHILPEIGIKALVYIAALFSLSVEKEKKAFWTHYLREQIWKVNTKPFMLAWGKCVLQLCWKYNFTPSDLTEWNKPFYLIESNNDFVFNPITRNHLRSRYPRAVCYTLSGANHLLWINRFRSISEILREFIL